MKETGKFYKAFDPNLCGLNGFQYEIGKEFTVDNPEIPEDNWRWASFSPYVAVCILNSHKLTRPFGEDALPRICEIEPIGKIVKFGKRKNDAYCTAHRIRIGRELSKREIVDLLWEDNADPMYFLDIQAPYEDLLKLKTKFRGFNGAYRIVHLPHLTIEQKRSLIAKSQYNVLEHYIAEQEEVESSVRITAHTI